MILESVDDVEIILEKILQAPEYVDVGALAGIKVEAGPRALYDSHVGAVAEEIPFPVIGAARRADRHLVAGFRAHPREPQGAVVSPYAYEIGVQHQDLHRAWPPFRSFSSISLR